MQSVGTNAIFCSLQVAVQNYISARSFCETVNKSGYSTKHSLSREVCKRVDRKRQIGFGSQKAASRESCRAGG